MDSNRGGGHAWMQWVDRYVRTETEVRILMDTTIPAMLKTQDEQADYLDAVRAEHDARIRELETNEKVKGGMLRALSALFSSPIVMALGRVALGLGMAGLAALSYLKPPP